MFKLRNEPFMNFIKNGMNWDNCDPKTNGECYLLSSLGHNWKLVMDIGANCGEYTEQLKVSSPKASIISFEPNPIAATKIKSDRRVIVEKIAVGEHTGTLVININTDDNTQSSSYRKSSLTTPVSLPVTTIDRYIKEHSLKHIDFVKIDTEGHELSVFRGAKSALKNRTIDYIQFEYGGTYIDAKTTLKMIYDLLSENYIICHILSHGVLPLSFSKQLETYRYSNWLAISRSVYRGSDS